MSDLLRYLPLLMEGATVTVALALIGYALAVILGALFAALRLGGGLIGRAVTGAYTTVGRSLPDLVVLLLLFYGGQRGINTLGDALGWSYVELSPFVAGVLALGLVYGAYLAETFRGAWTAVPRGQWEAATALGLPAWPITLRVLAPQVLRLALPGMANVWQVLIKATAVVSIIGLNDLVGRSFEAGRSVRQMFLFMAFVLLMYLIFTAISDRGFAWATRRMDRPYAR